ncbi:MAG: histidine phosphatase family protein [Clostridia bacterium]|nr:histidine phosphatase family protein [Clostridia bacterium]
MNFFYIHHAERDFQSNIEWNEHGLTNSGIKEAELLNEALIMEKEKIKIVAIYTSPYKRCVETAKILNRNLSLPILEDIRFNEIARNKGEPWKDFLNRNICAIDTIYKKYKAKNENVIIVTSGVNISAFICYFYNIRPTKNTPCSQALRTSPILFQKK